MFHPGRETTVTAAGKRWTVGRLTGAVLLAWRDWIAERVGDPFAAVERVKSYLPPDALMERVKAAEETAKDLERFSLGTATARAWLATELGLAKLLHLMLLPRHPDCSEDDAFTVAMALGMEEANAAVVRGAGEVPDHPNVGPAAQAGSTGTTSAAG